MSRRGCFASCRPISRIWRCLPSTPAAEIARSAACAGSGRSRCRSSAPRSSSFLARRVKNGDERLVVLNRIADRSSSSASRSASDARVRLRGQAGATDVELGLEEGAATAGLAQVRVHDLKHTFGRRLRAAGVSFEDRQDLLGHRSGRITTHYSAAELSRLIEAAEQRRRAERKKTRTGGVAGYECKQTPAKLPQANTVGSSVPIGQVFEIRWCRLRDLNSRPTVYKTAALPLS